MAEAEKSAALPGFMPDRLPEAARPPEDFNPIAVAKDLLRATRAGALATIDRNTGPPVLVARQCGDRCGWLAVDLGVAAVDPYGQYRSRSPRFGAARLHRQGRSAGPSAADRARHLRQDSTATPRTAYGRGGAFFHATRNPTSMPGFGDFSFWRLSVVSAHLNGGFARAADLKAGDIITDLDGACGNRRDRGRRGRAHECRSCGRCPALRHQAARRIRRRMAGHGCRPGRPRSRPRRSHGRACRLPSG